MLVDLGHGLVRDGDYPAATLADADQHVRDRDVPPRRGVVATLHSDGDCGLAVLADGRRTIAFFVRPLDALAHDGS